MEGICAVVCKESLSRVRFFVTPRTIACQALLSLGILQARILEWVASLFSRGSSRPRNWTEVSYIEGRFLPAELPERLMEGIYRMLNALLDINKIMIQVYK